ncbi:hypothetical protein PN462_15220 [Spirulina sp. CS-785/01]|uniref:hypothetical protein n=1 Tax=Spirulina sp. CS-785/01 TaxID=3021716 RepID=UPI00232D344F|nr:hypothetical protein [Spirulina sp. CS-785/01]MDB9314462.1 hypothetical protein [Spirulina sp. CS-785/01]
MADPLQEQPLQRLQQLLCFLPLVGIVPALWTLYQPHSTGKQRKTARQALTLTLLWAIAYSLTGIGATQLTALNHLRLLYLDSLITSGYFLTCLVFMGLTWRKAQADRLNQKSPSPRSS